MLSIEEPYLQIFDNSASLKRFLGRYSEKIQRGACATTL